MKRVSKSWKLFSALLIASILGATFFAGISVSGDIVSKQAATQAYSSVPIDFYWSPNVYGYGTSFSSQELVEIAASLSQIEGVNGTEVISKGNAAVENTSVSVELAGIQNDSLVTHGMKLLSGSEPLGANETYVWIGSSDLATLNLINSVITLNFSWFTGTEFRSATWNLTVSGVVSLTDRGLAIARGTPYYYSTYVTPYLSTPYYYSPQRENILLVSWEKTFSKMIDVFSNITGTYSPVQSAIVISIDRDHLVNPYDVQGSLNALNILRARIVNTISLYSDVSPYAMYVDSPLINALNNYQLQLMVLQLSFFGIAIPIFILAWYMGGTASEVSYNLRRREIGLLSTRGFTKRSITKLFITEALLIGLLSGFIGFLIGLLMVPIILGPAFPRGVQAFEYVYTVAGAQTLIATMIFGTFLAILSVYRAARKAAGIKAIDALKEYVHVEETKKPRISKLVWTAFILGTYKIVAWIIGFSPYTMLFTMPPNMIVYLVFWILTIVDSFLNFVGPFLFLYGSVKLVIQGSARLQKKIGSMGRRLFKDAGSLATTNVQRNRTRYATVAFLIALLAGYGVYVIATSASNRDYTYRTTYANVGADVSAFVFPSSNLTRLSTAVSNISGVSRVTYQRNVDGTSSQGGMLIRGVDPVKWLETAYYEEEWFRGASAGQAFQSMAKDNFTIILDSGVAQYLALKINDSIAVTLSTADGEKRVSLRVVGFFGPKQTVIQIGTFTYYTQFWSYIPGNLLVKMGGYSASDQLLVKVNDGANTTYVVNKILKVENVSSTNAADLVLNTIYSNYFVTGPQDVLNVAVALAVVGASLETAVVVLITLIERRREVALLSVRGMTFRQISSILLIELLSISIFALILGSIVGIIMTMGAVNSTTSPFYSSLVTMRMVFPLDSTLALASIMVLITLSVIVPILIAAKRAPKNITATWG